MEVFLSNHLYTRVSKKPSILTYDDGEFSWIRCEGKGSFLNSPCVKEKATSDIDSGSLNIIVDLEGCTGMDSTFMGTLAGIAMRLMKISDGSLKVAAPGDRNRQSLEDLGLDSIMEFVADDSSLDKRLSEVRGKMQPYTEGMTNLKNAPHVLDAHKKLCEADSSNTEKFSTVLDFLEADVKSQMDAGN